MNCERQILPILFLFAVMISHSVKGQGTSDLARLNELGIDLSITNNILYKSNFMYDFKIKSISVSPKDSVVLMADFNKDKELGKRWKLTSVNGAKPSAEKSQEFDREFNTTIPKKNDKALKQSIKIANEDSLYIYLEYSFDENYMSIEDYFLAKSRVQLKIEKRTKRLISARLKSTESVIVKIWNVDSYTVNIRYVYNEDASKVLVKSKTYVFNVNMLGSKGKLSNIVDYYQFHTTE